MADELRLKASATDYQTKMQDLQNKMDELENIYKEYSDLKLEAYRVVGEGDSNLEQLKATIDKNMEAVGRQHAALKQTWEKLNKQNEELGILTSDIGKLLQDASDKIGQAANTFKTMSDM